MESLKINVYGGTISMFNREREHKQGFTLIELTITILIIAVLFVLLTVEANAQVNKSKEAGVETAFHEYYIGAKSAILQGDGETLTNKDKFVELMNDYIDDAVEVDTTTVSEKFSTMKATDPWSNSYRYVWNSKDYDNDGKEEYWMAFLSEGADPKLNWVHEADRQDNNVKYQVPASVRTTDNGTEFKYIELLGYYDTGVMIDSSSLSESEKNDILSDLLTGTLNGSGGNTGGNTSGGNTNPDDNGSTTNPDDTQSVWVFKDGADEGVGIKGYTGKYGSDVDLVLPTQDDKGNEIAGWDVGWDPVAQAPGVSPFKNKEMGNITVPGEYCVGSKLFEGITAKSVTISKDEMLWNGNLTYGAFVGSTIKNLYIGKTNPDMTNQYAPLYDSTRNAAIYPYAYELTTQDSSLFWEDGAQGNIENVEIHSNIPCVEFKNCGVKTVKIGSEVTVIGEEAFAGCDGIQVTIDNTKGSVDIKANAFPAGTILTYTDGTEIY